MAYTINELAKMAGVTVRTLHYYDEIGLVTPSFVKPNGYRCYEKPELFRLQQVLFFRELGFSLEQIKGIVDSPGFDVAEALRDQKKLLELKKARLNGLLKTIDKTIEDVEGEIRMTSKELYSSFTSEQIEEYRQEVIDKWGKDCLRESEARIAAWSPHESEWVQQEAKDVVGGIVACIEAGKAPDDTEVQELIGRYYFYIRKFFDCTVEIFRELGKMYVQDERFAAYYLKYHPDMPVFMRDAMAAWCNTQ